MPDSRPVVTPDHAAGVVADVTIAANLMMAFGAIVGALLGAGVTVTELRQMLNSAVKANESVPVRPRKAGAG